MALAAAGIQLAAEDYRRLARIAKIGAAPLPSISIGDRFLLTAV